MLEELDRLLKVEEGVETVAHGVLQLEVAADNLHRLRVVYHAAAQSLKSLHELRLLGLELCVGVRVRGIDHRAGRQDKRHGFERAVRVELRAAGHAGRVVGDDTADGRSHRRRWVRAQLVPPQLQAGVDLADRRTRLDAHACAAVKDLHVLEVTAGIDEDTVTGGLAGQRGAAGAQRHRLAIARGGFEHRGDLGRVFRDDDGLRHVVVVRSIRGVLHALHELRANVGGGKRNGGLSLIHSWRGHDLYRMSTRAL